MESRKHIYVGVAAAVLLHVVAAAVLSIPGVLDALLAKKAKPEVVKVEEPKAVISLRITPRKELVPTPIPELQVQPKKRFIQTNQANTAEAPKRPTFYGAHDNVAQSSAKATAGAPKIAASDGEKRNHINAESQFRDAELNQPVTPPSQKPIVAEIPAPPKLAQQAKLEAQQKMPKELAAKKTPKYLKNSRKIPVEQQLKEAEERLKEEKRKAAELAKKEEEKRKRVAQEKARKQQAEEAKKAAQKKRELAAKKSGFQRRSDPTKNVGSVMRKGKVSSNDTAATPEGRYKQNVLNAINKDWSRRMGRHPDLALPGVLVIRWLVYPPGQVKGIQLVEEQHGSAIQKGITFQSIKQANIPNMPGKVSNLLQGEPMEFIVTFYF